MEKGGKVFVSRSSRMKRWRLSCTAIKSHTNTLHSHYCISTKHRLVPKSSGACDTQVTATSDSKQQSQALFGELIPYVRYHLCKRVFSGPERFPLMLGPSSKWYGVVLLIDVQREVIYVGRLELCRIIPFRIRIRAPREGVKRVMRCVSVELRRPRTARVTHRK